MPFPDSHCGCLVHHIDLAIENDEHGSPLVRTSMPHHFSSIVIKAAEGETVEEQDVGKKTQPFLRCYDFTPFFPHPFGSRNSDKRNTTL